MYICIHANAYMLTPAAQFNEQQAGDMRSTMATAALSPMSAKKLQRRVVVAESSLAEAKKHNTEQQIINKELQLGTLRLERQAAKQLRSFGVAIDEADQKLTNAASALQREKKKRTTTRNQNSALRTSVKQKEVELKELGVLVDSLSGVQNLDGLLTALLPVEERKQLEGSIPTAVSEGRFVHLCMSVH